MQARRALIPTLVGLSTCGAQGRGTPATGRSSPIAIPKGVSQLFVDDSLIAQQRGLRRTLHQLRKDHGGDEPVLALDREFGDSTATLEANGTIIYDPKLRKYVMFALGFSPAFRGPSADRVRLFRFTSKDGMTWVKGDDGTAERIPFDLRDATSGTSATNIDLFSCTYGSLWLGGLKIWHAGGAYPYSAAGSAFLKLVSSHDGLHWSKIRFPNDTGTPEVFLPNGPEGGNGGRNDGGYVTEFSQGPLRIGDQLIYYYGCSSWGKNRPREQRVTGGGIFRARLRVDGFVSVDGGTLTTTALAFDGNELSVNSAGAVGVEVLDAAGRILGHGEVTGDSLRHRVRFQGKSLRRLASRGTVRLRFTLGAGGHLYSFAVN